MKKLFLLMMCLSPISVFAKQYSSTDLPPNNYVIGEHLFSGDTELTMKHIMLSSRTIVGEEFNDMLVYYKDPWGSWVDGVTGAALNYVPAIFNIKFYDLKPEQGDNYMDVNTDGKVNSLDLFKLSNYIDKTDLNLSEAGKLNSDLNLDGKINYVDLEMLSKHLSGWSITIPDDKYIQSTIYGDSDEDGKISNSDLVKAGKYIKSPDAVSMTSKAKLNADVNLDGKIDYIDLEMMNKKLHGLNVNIPSASYQSDIKYGDINKDDSINASDMTLIQRHIKNIEKLTDEQKIIADLNMDGEVDATDLDLLRKYVLEQIEDIPVPGYEMTAIYGDLDQNMKVDIDDVVELYLKIKYNEEYTEQEKLNSDLNLDNEINTTDLDILYTFVTGQITTLPALDFVSETVYGDVNLDGDIKISDVQDLQAYLKGTIELTGQSLKNSDVNLDGEVDDIDVEILYKYVMKKITELPEVDYEFDKLYGDVNYDLKVDEKDLNYLNIYLEAPKDINLSKHGVVNADVNLDGVINDVDYEMIEKHINDENIELPDENYEP